jgi:1H-pyrrole-2-carbonyl-[peptidyl-carrier protein] chlorinase
MPAEGRPVSVHPQYDVVVVGGGPSGATLGCLLAQAGYHTLLLEKDIHPRFHVGESLTPAANQIFKRIGFLTAMEDAGFIHKPGVCWTAPRGPVGKFVAIRLAEFPMPGATQTYAYNVERDAFDALLLRHAHEQGATVLQGAHVRNALRDGDRVVGVRVTLGAGWEQDIRARFVVDASGRRCLIANQLKLKKKDSEFNQFGIYSWFRHVEPNPPDYDGFLVLHFLGLERCWAWQIPLRDCVWSVGVVTDKQDFQKSGRTNEEFFQSLVSRNRSFSYNMRNAHRIRPWRVEADYSYRVERMFGPGWVLIGDSLGFVDPIFSTGMDVATHSALYAFEAIDATIRGADEEAAFGSYERRIRDGIDAWYELTALFYKLQNLFTAFAVRRRFREPVVRILQGNPYSTESQDRARQMIAILRNAYEHITADPGSLLRPGALDGNRSGPPLPPDGQWSPAPAPRG